jgi:hypothetical protein
MGITKEQGYDIILNDIINELSLQKCSDIEKWQWFHAYIYELSKNNWTREAIFLLNRELIAIFYKQKKENVVMELGEFETSLIGDCHKNSIFRLYNDIEDDNDLTFVVRGIEWSRIEWS